jgi:hypothetical protein
VKFAAGNSAGGGRHPSQRSGQKRRAQPDDECFKRQDYERTPEKGTVKTGRGGVHPVEGQRGYGNRPVRPSRGPNAEGRSINGLVSVAETGDAGEVGRAERVAAPDGAEERSILTKNELDRRVNAASPVRRRW